MPGRRKTTTAVIEEPETTFSAGNIESVKKEEVDEHVKPLLDSANFAEAVDAQPVPDEDRLKDLMSRMLHARERAQEATERVREINAELVGRDSMPDNFKEKYKLAVRDLTMSRRAASLTRAELVAAMKGWHRSLRMAY